MPVVRSTLSILQRHLLRKAGPGRLEWLFQKTMGVGRHEEPAQPATKGFAPIT